MFLAIFVQEFLVYCRIFRDCPTFHLCCLALSISGSLPVKFSSFFFVGFLFCFDLIFLGFDLSRTKTIMSGGFHATYYNHHRIFKFRVQLVARHVLKLGFEH